MAWRVDWEIEEFFPAIYYNRFFPKSGGLISYGIDFAESYRLAAGYLDRILKGANPADLPVDAPSSELLIWYFKVYRKRPSQ